MNTTNLTGAVGDHLYQWDDVFKVMCTSLRNLNADGTNNFPVPLSFMIITFSLILTFSSWARAGFSLALNIPWDWLIAVLRIGRESVKLGKMSPNTKDERAKRARKRATEEALDVYWEEVARKAEALKAMPSLHERVRMRGSRDEMV